MYVVNLIIMSDKNKKQIKKRGVGEEEEADTNY